MKVHPDDGVAQKNGRQAGLSDLKHRLNDAFSAYCHLFEFV